MSRRAQRDLVYDAPLADVHAMLHDPAFRQEVLARQKVLHGDATVTDETVRVDRAYSADGLPSFATKFVGDELEIVQVEDWTSEDHADMQISIPGKPGEISGTIGLVESGGRTTQTVTFAISVRIPLIGGKIEAMVESMLLKALDKEHATGQEWLAR
ncbi:MAG: DUF2505 domain-containing protein [Nocardioides sp.]|nr:DUF2505 domain-containing protein [Nocardioides sp.]